VELLEQSGAARAEWVYERSVSYSMYLLWDGAIEDEPDGEE
jgi:hypothetical protein